MGRGEGWEGVAARRVGPYVLYTAPCEVSKGRARPLGARKLVAVRHAHEIKCAGRGDVRTAHATVATLLRRVST
jgi:hypothetical protein